MSATYHAFLASTDGGTGTIQIPNGTMDKGGFLVVIDYIVGTVQPGVTGLACVTVTGTGAKWVDGSIGTNPFLVTGGNGTVTAPANINFVPPAGFPLLDALRQPVTAVTLTANSGTWNIAVGWHYRRTNG